MREFRWKYVADAPRFIGRYLLNTLVVAVTLLPYSVVALLVAIGCVENMGLRAAVAWPICFTAAAAVALKITPDRFNWWVGLPMGAVFLTPVLALMPHPWFTYGLDLKICFAYTLGVLVGLTPYPDCVNPSARDLIKLWLAQLERAVVRMGLRRADHAAMKGAPNTTGEMMGMALLTAVVLTLVLAPLLLQAAPMVAFFLSLFLLMFGDPETPTAEDEPRKKPDLDDPIED